MAKKSDYGYKRWVFTINNPTFEDYVSVIEFCTAENCKFAIVGEEKGEKEGTPHLQGFLSLRKNARAAALEENLGGRAWLSRAVGSDEENEEYCSKETTYLRVGTPNRKGRSSDLNAAASEVLAGAPMTDVARKYPTTYIMFGRGLERLRQLIVETLRDWKTEVIVLIGPPGSGKSRYVFEFPAERKYYKARGKWWDGYEGNDVVVMDDFYGWLPYDDLLRICDRYPIRVEYKGGMTQFVAKTLIITSNREPREWYKCEVDCTALYRRIDRYLVQTPDGFLEAPEFMLPYKIKY
ncbi:putative replication-associated protein [Swan circovirus]|uniref:Replication-associated protein n=1 Tax=Swan circovirus TaxID=459957 RepID=B0YPT4_9CIRC|nr:putative replication-associated protein [Swan circovirus]ABU48443.1 putative replication-associated protein [Swan circovirus]